MHLKFITPIILLMLAAMAVSTGGNNESRVDSIPTGTIIQDNAGLGEAFARINANTLSEGLDRLDADLHPTPNPTPKPTPEPQPAIRASHTHSSSSPIERIIISRLEINASVVVKGIDANGAMETPEGPWEAAWYAFTHEPGSSDGKGNAVFSGHVDALFTGQDAPAVFFHLKSLVSGDKITVVMTNGKEYEYRVFETKSVVAATADVASIVGRTEKEIITLITCGGPSGVAYSQRLIVRAERLDQ